MPNIIRPYKEISVERSSRITGHVKIKKIRGDGSVSFSSEFDNLVLNTFLQNGFFNVNSYKGNIFGLGLLLGTGTQTTPQPSDTTLGNALYLNGLRSVGQAEAGTTVTFLTEADTVLGPTPADDYKQVMLTTTFDYGQGNGDLTELGIVANYLRDTPTNSGYFAAPNDHGLLTKTLIKDSQGTPITLTKTSSEKLIVEYELRMYRPNHPSIDVTLNGDPLRLYFTTLTHDLTLQVDQTDLSGTAVSGRGSTSNNRDYLMRTSTSIDWTQSAYLMGTDTLGTMLHKASHPYPVSSRMNTDSFNDLTNGAFKHYARVEPDTVDRLGNVLSTTNLFGGASFNSPTTYAFLDRTTTYSASIMILDPVTNYPKKFTLPANYRLDFEYTFERTR